MRNIIIGLFICVLLSIPAGVEAQDWNDYGSLELGMVDGEDSSVLEWTYEYNETPWVHLYDIPIDTNPDLDIHYLWQHYVSGVWEVKQWEEEWVGSSEISSGEWWKSPENWADLKQPGSWEVVVSVFGYCVDEEDPLFALENSTEFYVNVVPEPVSSVLYIIGGASLVFFRYYKRKKNCKG